MGFSRQEYWSGVPLPSPVYRNKTIANPHQVSTIRFQQFNTWSVWFCFSFSNPLLQLYWNKLKHTVLSVNTKKERKKVKSLSCVRLFATPWAPDQAPPSMRFSRQEYWNGLPLRITQTLIVAVSKLASLTVCLLFQSVAMAATVLRLLMKNSSCSLSSPGTRRTQWEQQLWPKQGFSTQVSQRFGPSSCLAAHWSWACI